MNRTISKELTLFLIIIAIAVFFRFYQLDIIPPGLWPDEAANGVDALKSLDECRYFNISSICPKSFKIFYPANNGREGLFINIQALSIAMFGAEPWALRVVSAVMGTLTVVGLYLLVRYLFHWRLAAIASFFMAVSFWHVNFSRIGFRAIMLPLVLVWGFYFLWKGLRKGSFKDFLIAGLITGIGFYTYFSFRIAPLIGIVVFLNYWSYVKTDFSFSKYEHAKNQLLRGFALVVLTAIAVALPMMVYFYTHPEDFLKREGRPISIFTQEKPMQELGISLVRTLGMFNFSGDHNQRHNIPGWPELSLPIGIFFAIGFIKEFIHWLSRKHNPPSLKTSFGRASHFSVVHTFLFSWFFIMLIPGFLSIEAPHALRVIGVIPVVMIFAAFGFWWLIQILSRFYQVHDPHHQFNERISRHETKIVSSIVITTLVLSIGFLEYSRYFITWGKDLGTRSAFSQNYEDIAEYLNTVQVDMPKYILINEGDVMVDSIANNAQTVKFLTRTHSQQCSTEKQIYYLRPDQMPIWPFPNHYLLIPLSADQETEYNLTNRYGLNKLNYDSFTVFGK